MNGRKALLCLTAASLVVGSSAAAIYAQVVKPGPEVSEPGPEPTETIAPTDSEMTLAGILLENSGVRRSYSSQDTTDQIASPAVP